MAGSPIDSRLERDAVRTKSLQFSLVQMEVYVRKDMARFMRQKFGDDDFDQEISHIDGYNHSSSWIPTTDGSGEVRITSCQYTLVWDDTSARWEGIVFSGSIEFRDNAGVLAQPQSAGGTVIMDWENINGLFSVEFEFDATGGQNPIPI